MKDYFHAFIFVTSNNIFNNNNSLCSKFILDNTKVIKLPELNTEHAIALARTLIPTLITITRELAGGVRY